MNGGLCLSYAELVELTGLKKYSAQHRWLRREGFIAKTRANGMPVVSRAHFLSMMGCSLPGVGSSSSNQEPDFTSLS
jgi:hypothetical protein